MFRRQGVEKPAGCRHGQRLAEMGIVDRVLEVAVRDGRMAISGQWWSSR